MFQILHDTRIPFMRYRRHAYIFSIVVMVLGGIALAMRGGFNLGVDFAGGRVIELRFSQPVGADEVRAACGRIGLRGAEIQESGVGQSEGRDYIVRLPAETERLATEESPAEPITRDLAQSRPGLTSETLREELVGPRVGKELRGKATVAVLIALLGILVYIGLRYEFTFALGGVAALAHDVIVTLLILNALGKELTISTVAALLTIGGYSINDTVVVFDRIREQSRLLTKRSLPDVIDTAVNVTLSRTLITSATTIYAIAALFFLGGEVIHDFALAMLIGVGFGTYSSVYVASALACELGLRRERIQREKAAQAA